MKFPNFDTLEKKAGQAIVEALASSVIRATAFISPTFVVSVQRRHKPDKRARAVELVVKIGAPNFRERHFIGLCKKSGVAFPLRNIQLKHFNKPKRVRRKK